MKRTVILTIAIVVGSILVGSLAAFGVAGAKDAGTGANMNVLNVTGTGVVKAKPDKFIVPLTISTTDKSARTAQQENDKKANDLIDTLKKMDVKDDDMVTSGYTLNPVYKYFPDENESRIVGYQASYTLTVTAYDLKKIGEIIDAGTDKGVNGIGGVVYAVKNEEELMTEALKRAMRDARTKADIALNAYGLKVYQVTTISLNSTSPVFSQNNPPMRGAADKEGGAGGVAPNIMTGDLSFFVQVYVEFAY